jgi:hypothetical protein
MDTTSTSARDCALAIRDFVARGPVPRAFDRLRTALLGAGSGPSSGPGSAPSTG